MERERESRTSEKRPIFLVSEFNFEGRASYRAEKNQLRFQRGDVREIPIFWPPSVTAYQLFAFYLEGRASYRPKKRFLSLLGHRTRRNPIKLFIPFQLTGKALQVGFAYQIKNYAKREDARALTRSCRCLRIDLDYLSFSIIIIFPVTYVYIIFYFLNFIL